MIQSQFVETNVTTLDIKRDEAPYCDRSQLDGSDCENRAKLKIFNPLEEGAKYSCESHAKGFELQKAGLRK